MKKAKYMHKPTAKHNAYAWIKFSFFMNELPMDHEWPTSANIKGRNLSTNFFGQKLL